jgi:Ca2+-binding RTX toxin-like protein
VGGQHTIKWTDRPRRLALGATILLAAGAITPSAVAAPRTCFGTPATIVGTKRADVIRGTKNQDVIVALGGRDLINGRGSSDLICAGRGIDGVVGRGGKDLIDGGGGADSLSGGSDPDLIRTGRGRLNFVSGDGGNDSIRGGPGLDVVDYFTANRPIVADLERGSATGQGRDFLSRVDGLSGSEFDDSFTGNAGANVLIGGGGDDSLASAGNSASLESPSEASTSDILAGDGAGRGRDGNDVMTGGTGVNVLSFAGARSNVTVSLEAGTALGEGEDSFSDMDVVIGSYFADTLIGNTGDNAFQPLDGDDNVEGAGGRDVSVYTLALGVTIDLRSGSTTGEGRDRLSSIEDIWASDFNDQVDGDDTANRIYALGGADRVAGHGGDDLLDGGTGLDSLDGGPDSDSCLGGEQTSACEDGGSIDPANSVQHRVGQDHAYRWLRTHSSLRSVPEAFGDGSAEELIALWIGSVRKSDDQVPRSRGRKLGQTRCDPFGTAPESRSAATLRDLLRLPICTS